MNALLLPRCSSVSEPKVAFDAKSPVIIELPSGNAIMSLP